MVKGSTLKNIEQGIHRLWPTEWITQTITEIKEELDSANPADGVGERIKRLNQCAVDLATERVKRNAA